MLSQTLLLAAMAILSIAAPTPSVADDVASKSDPYHTSWELAAFYAAISQHIEELKRTPGYKTGAASCDMTAAAKNFPAATTPLASPAAGSSLKHVLIGTGSQNYTCPSPANATAVPTAIGAYANLFNASCIAATDPSLLTMLPSLAYEYPLSSEYYPPDNTIGESAKAPAGTFSYQPLNLIFSGLHTFANTTEPRFNLAIPGVAVNNGLILAKKNSSAAAPSSAAQGANGAVPWLKLDTIAGTTNGYTNVYRVETQGGMQPATCGQMTGEFQVPYSASYWIWGM